MRDCKRNQTSIYYSLLEKTDEKDKYGNPLSKYSEPVMIQISVSPNTGEATMEPFGRQVDYDREMVTHDMECPINEFSHLWIGIDTDSPYNYIVKKVAKSLNCIRYAIKEVNAG